MLPEGAARPQLEPIPPERGGGGGADLGRELGVWLPPQLEQQGWRRKKLGQPTQPSALGWR
eukprot:3196195-Prymnesium_polylepis.1